MSQSNSLYPIFLKLNQLNTLIVGGGNVALEKVSFILKSSPDANITLVAPHFKPELKQLISKYPQVKKIQRSFITDDLIGKHLVLVGTENEELNYLIKAEAKARNILTNVADTPGICDFYMVSIVTKGDLKIGISTNGKSPTFAKRFREILEHVLPDDIPDLLDNLRIVRDSLSGDFPDKVRQLNQITFNLVSNIEDGKLKPETS